MLYLSQLTDLFRQASDLRIGDTARVLMGHVVYQGVHLSGQVPVKKKNKKQTGHTYTKSSHKPSSGSFLFIMFADDTTPVGFITKGDEAADRVV